MNLPGILISTGFFFTQVLHILIGTIVYRTASFDLLIGIRYTSVRHPQQPFTEFAMSLRIPSAKSLETAFPGKGKQVRELLVRLRGSAKACGKDFIGLAPVADLVGMDLQKIHAGHNAKSPAITYINKGDTYDTTLMRVNGVLRVGNWGSIVEAGNYD